MKSGRVYALCFFFGLILGVIPCEAATYYVDAIDGNDTYDGTSTATAWKSLDKVNSTVLSPGDSLLFKAGCNWNGLCWPKGSGVEGNPVRIDMYGDANNGLPHIAGPVDGVTRPAFFLYNVEYIEVNNLEITHHDPTSILRRNGIMIHLDEPNLVGKQVLNHIYLRNLEIHNVNGQLNNYNNGGIYMTVSGDGNAVNKAWFNDILIENCNIYDVNTAGIINWTDFAVTSATNDSAVGYYTNFVIRGCTFSRISGRALHTRQMEGPLVEYCVASGCNWILGEGEEANCFVEFGTNNSLWQYNEVYDTAKYPGEPDGGAFDLDYRSKNCIAQYNYSHDNGMAFSAPCMGADVLNFNYNPIFRYNISQNDKVEVYHLSGGTDNCQFYNNTVYLGTGISDNIIVLFKSWNGYSTNTKFYNNILYNLSTNASYDFGGATNTTFDYNVFYGSHPTSEPADAHKLTGDPCFISPGTGGIGMDTLDGYRLRTGSICIDSGMTIANNGGQDFWGNAVPYNGVTDRGAHEYSGYVLDVTSPVPNPMTWSSVPAAISSDTITMTATTAIDPNGNGVQYYFNNVTIPNHDSGWQPSPTYADTGLSNYTSYTYQVKARDLSENTNETAYSTQVFARTLSNDFTAPSPDPMTWASAPAAASTTEITMTATTATDIAGVEYYFDCVTAGGNDSGWQSSSVYTDKELFPGKSYTYQVKARDLSPNSNETAYSTQASATTTAMVGGITIFEKFDTDPTSRGWVNQSAGSTVYAYNSARWLDVQTVRDSANLARYYKSLPETYTKTKEFWFEMDLEPVSTTNDNALGYFGVFNSGETSNERNSVVDRFSMAWYTNTSTGVKSWRGNRHDLYGYNSAGEQLTIASSPYAPGIAFGTQARVKGHYRYVGGVGAVSLRVFAINADGSTGDLIMSAAETPMIGADPKALAFNIFGLACRTNGILMAKNIAKVDNMYFSTAGPNPKPVIPSFGSFVLPGDFEPDNDVDWSDVQIFAGQWLSSSCVDPSWCGGCDLNQSGTVSFEDYAIMAENWLEVR